MVYYEEESDAGPTVGGEQDMLLVEEIDITMYYSFDPHTEQQ